jgi:hypothetical protein
MVIFDTRASLLITHDLGGFLAAKTIGLVDAAGRFCKQHKNCLWKRIMYQQQIRYFCLLRQYLVPILEMRRSLRSNSIIKQSFPYHTTVGLHCPFLVGPEPEPTLNIAGILDDSNHNLTGGQKLLLEWHCRFADLNFQGLQSVIRIIPFMTKRFEAAVKSAPPRYEV